ncbi:MAG: hypothetical protein ER33_04995 [Cyanobium sp. CACIAM 14]|nr:MAG: hypothetical protein ER33_04995 [Cyanobium sp. CACIAM 14]
MADTRFRVWFGEKAASEEELARIEEIEVTQEMDALWEARLRMVLCLDPKGRWLHWPGDTAEPFSRVRVEVDLGDGRFAPLIDGPLVSIDAGLDARPGRSTATLVVRDDSAFLNRDEDVERFENLRHSDVAERVFGRFEQIATPAHIQPTAATPETTMRRGTVLQFLHELARLNDRHAYVLPGEEHGAASIGCFLGDPEDAADLPPLLMIGEGRNLANASISEDPDGAGITRARVLRVSDQGVTRFQTGAADLGLLRELPAVPADLTPRRLLHPADNTAEDPEAAVTAQARRQGYTYRLSSQVIPGCYGAVLTPYRKVPVVAGATPFSGDYLITKVVHRLSPSVYTQQLEAKSNSLSEVSTAQRAEARGGGLRLSVSVGGGIF